MAFLIILFSSWFHAFHVSVTNIIYKADQKTVQVEQSIFLDDFEEALRDYSGNQKLDITEDDQKEIAALVKKYLSEKFQLISNGQSIPLVFIGSELEVGSNAMWCYWEAEKVKKFDRFRVRNAALIEKFDDQENIIHYKAASGTKSERAGSKNEWVEFGS